MFIKKNINNFTILFDSSGSIYITELSILLMSDLHIGKSYSCAKNGNFLPPFEIDETIEKIKSIVDFYNPKKIISLGDSFHEASTLEIIDNIYIKNLNKIFKKREVIFIDGNHDAELKSKEKIDAIFKDSLKLDNFNFTHIKNSKIINNLFEFSGHFHPKVSIISNRVTYSFKCFVLGKKLLYLTLFWDLHRRLKYKFKHFEKNYTTRKNCYSYRKKSTNRNLK